MGMLDLQRKKLNSCRHIRSLLYLTFLNMGEKNEIFSDVFLSFWTDIPDSRDMWNNRYVLEVESVEFFIKKP